MNTILQKRIEEAAQKELEETLEVTMSSQCANIAYQEFLNGIKYILQNQWISVDEALPPLDDGMESVSIEVVVKNEYGKATCAWYSYVTNTWHLSYGEIAGDDLIDFKITHWMSIPKLKGGKNE